MGTKTHGGQYPSGQYPRGTKPQDLCICIRGLCLLYRGFAGLSRYYTSPGRDENNDMVIHVIWNHPSGCVVGTGSDATYDYNQSTIKICINQTYVCCFKELYMWMCVCRGWWCGVFWP